MLESQQGSLLANIKFTYRGNHGEKMCSLSSMYTFICMWKLFSCKNSKESDYAYIFISIQTHIRILHMKYLWKKIKSCFSPTSIGMGWNFKQPVRYLISVSDKVYDGLTDLFIFTLCTLKILHIYHKQV